CTCSAIACWYAASACGTDAPRLASGRGTGMLAGSQEGDPQMHPAEQSPLGKTSEYSGIYTPSLLYPIPRQPIWEGLGLDPQRLPFHGADVWNSYEVSWLTPSG